MSQLNKWMLGGKISKLVVVVTDKETGEHVERWQFDVWQPPEWIRAEAHQNSILIRSKYSESIPRAKLLENLLIRRMPLRGMSASSSHVQHPRY
jgi:hypothetical protein